MCETITITIHRGLNQIGGSITEISTATTRIFIDMGENLPGEGEPMDNEQKQAFVDRLFAQNTRQHQAVVYTHSHSDHIGMMRFVPSEVEQYCSQTTRDILEIKNSVMSKAEGDKSTEFAEQFDIIKSRLKTFQAGHSLNIGDIVVQPFGVSHSTDGACCLVITAGGKKIFHTGDFRFGLTGYPDIRTVAKTFSDTIDVLITEGTNLNTQPDTLKSENALLPEFVNAFSDKLYNFVLTSSTDIERLSVIRQAAEISQRKFIAASTIFCKMLSYFKKKWPHRYRPTYEKLSFSCPNEKHIARMRDKGFVMVVSANQLDKVKAFAAEFEPEQVQLVYSAWPGYYEIPEQAEINPMYSAFRAVFDHIVDVHASGHADRTAIAEIISTIRPKSAIIGIHKPYGSSLRSLQFSDDLKVKIHNEKTLQL